MDSVVTEAQVAGVAATSGADSAVGVLVTTTRLDSSHPQFPEIGVDPAALGALGVQVVAGRPYSASATDEIMLGWQAAEDLGKRVGDTLPLDDTIYRVVGIYSIEQVFGDVASMLPLIPMQARWHPFHTGLVAGALVAVAVTLLIVQNGQSVRVSRLAFHFRSPEWIVLFVTAAAGAVVWELIRAGFRRARHRRRAGGQGRPDPAR